jgi:hypothetical protein
LYWNSVKLSIKSKGCVARETPDPGLHKSLQHLYLSTGLRKELIGKGALCIAVPSDIQDFPMEEEYTTASNWVDGQKGAFSHYSQTLCIPHSQK